MSYQQTRSVQDAPSYPQNITNVVNLRATGAPPGSPPSGGYSTITYANVPIPVTNFPLATYTAASANEKATIEYFITAIGTGGAATGLIGAHRVSTAVTTTANTSMSSFLGATNEFTATLAGWNIPGQVDLGNQTTIQLAITSVGTATITVTALTCRTL